ncbi:MAG TPA: hypothetical protein VMS64_26975 [Candidatus Methylomirabilis sp.]|nr:hypothetical protein [Candidatus Methylomirabilis sp.]
MLRPVVRALILLLVLGLAGCATYGPPPPPGPGYVWIPPHWIAGPFGYHWVPGYYRFVP